MKPPPPGACLPPRKILVRELNWLGDAVMSTPALQRLRQHYPHADITLLSQAKLADLWLHFPFIDHVETIASGEPPWGVGRRLRPVAFELALILPNSPRSVLESWFARIPRRVGFTHPWRNWFLTQAVPPRPDRRPMRKRSVGEIRRLIGNNEALPLQPAKNPDAHQLHEYLHLVAQLGGDSTPLRPSLTMAEDETRATAQKFGLEAPARVGKPILALNPGAEYGPAKRWPVDKFITAALEIQKRTECAWLILGAGPDRPLANTIAAALQGPHSSIMNLAGQTSLRELMAVLKICRVLLTNDTGPMHLAAALGTSVVVPFGSTSPELTGPGLPGDTQHHLLTANVPCTPCFQRTCPIDFRCMNAITVDRAVGAVLEILSRLASQ